MRSPRRFPDWQPPEIQHGIPTKWQWTVWHPERFTLGRDTDIGAGTHIFAQYGVEIREGVQLGGGCFVYSENTIDGTKGKVTIKEGARIGTHSTIFPNVTIGRNALVGAYSLMKGDVPDGAVVMGIPAELKGEKEGDGRTHCIRGRRVRSIGSSDSPYTPPVEGVYIQR